MNDIGNPNRNAEPISNNVEQRGGVRDNIPRWVPWLVSFTILAGVGLCIFMVTESYLGHQPQPAAFTSMLFLLLFALGTLTAMLFITKESFRATAGNYTLMISGPAALWFGGTLLIIGTPAIRQELFKAFTWPETITALESNILSIEQNSGWITYRDWKAKNNDYAQQVISNERSLVSELLENAFTFPAPRGRENDAPLLVSPHISTVFFYFPKYVLKFQMISGHQQDNASEVDIFFANRSTDESRLSKALLIGDTTDNDGPASAIAKGITETTVQQDHFGWEPIIGVKNVRCLNVVKYYDGNSRDEDRILVDMKKFTNRETGGQADLMVLNYERKIAGGSKMWRMKGSVGTTAHQVPLLFREYDSGNLALLSQVRDTNQTTADNGEYSINVQQELSSWFALLDAYLKFGPSRQGDDTEKSANVSTQAFLQNIRSDMVASLKALGYQLSDEGSFQALLQPNIKPRGVAAFHVENATDVNVVLIKPKLDVSAAVPSSRS
jgi:hypothetical protein